MNDPGFDLEMPFVVTASHGGPYDDDAYTAGWEAGHIDTLLQLARDLGLGLPELTVHRANLPQIDLIAMRYGISVTERHFDNLPDDVRDQWAHLVLRWTS